MRPKEKSITKAFVFSIVLVSTVNLISTAKLGLHITQWLDILGKSGMGGPGSVKTYTLLTQEVCQALPGSAMVPIRQYSQL